MLKYHPLLFFYGLSPNFDDLIFMFVCFCDLLWQRRLFFCCFFFLANETDKKNAHPTQWWIAITSVHLYAIFFNHKITKTTKNRTYINGWTEKNYVELQDCNNPCIVSTHTHTYHCVEFGWKYCIRHIYPTYHQSI